MERAGGALHAGLRTTAHASTALPFSQPTLLARSVHDRPPQPRAGGRTWPLRRAPPCVGAKLLLAERFRSCYCLKEEGLIMRKALQNSSLRVFSSHGPQEADLNTEDIRKDKFLIDCGTDQECVVGGVVALGKFDALHIGHRELAVQASKAGTPFLLSFVGMAEVLGWESRPPIVAKCDRKRVLSTWAPYCGNVVPVEYQLEFSNVRHLTPRQFVERLSKDLRVSGVVAGENYRFGYKASGDVSDLVRLCKEYDLSAFIVSSVMDRTQRSYNGASKGTNLSDRGQVSSTRVRHALAMGDMEYVTELLGRKHRLMLMLNKRCLSTNKRIAIPKSCMLNQPPVDGAYECCTLLVDDSLVAPCRVVIDPENINIELDSATFSAQALIPDGRPISIEFG